MVKKVMVVIAILITTMRVSAQCDTADIIQNFWDSLSVHPRSINTERAVTLMECPDSFSVITIDNEIFPKKFSFLPKMNWEMKTTKTILLYNNGWKTHVCEPYYFEANKMLVAYICGYVVFFLLLIWNAFHHRNYFLRELKKRKTQKSLEPTRDELIKEYNEYESLLSFAKFETFFSFVLMIGFCIAPSMYYRDITGTSTYYISMAWYTVCFFILSILVRKIITCSNMKKLQEAL